MAKIPLLLAPNLHVQEVLERLPLMHLTHPTCAIQSILLSNILAIDVCPLILFEFTYIFRSLRWLYCVSGCILDVLIRALLIDFEL